MKKNLPWLVALIVLVVGAYIGLWVYSHQWLEREIDRVYAEAADGDIKFLGPKPEVRGFPFVPEIYYTGGFQSGDLTVTFPEFILRGYPIPGLSFTADFPQGVALGGGLYDPSLWVLDNVWAKIAVPARVPSDYTLENMQAWQQSGGKIDVRDYKVAKGALESVGHGILQLDDNLQPDFYVETTMTGHEVFVQDLMHAQLIEHLPAAILTGMLNSLARIDEDTGEKEVFVSLGIKNRILSVGPVQVARIPEIVWDTHTPPALRQ